MYSAREIRVKYNDDGFVQFVQVRGAGGFSIDRGHIVARSQYKYDFDYICPFETPYGLMAVDYDHYDRKTLIVPDTFIYFDGLSHAHFVRMEINCLDIALRSEKQEHSHYYNALTKGYTIECNGYTFSWNSMTKGYKDGLMECYDGDTIIGNLICEDALDIIHYGIDKYIENCRDASECAHDDEIYESWRDMYDY